MITKIKYNSCSKLFLVSAMVFALNACGSGDEEESTLQDTSVQVVARDAIFNTKPGSSAYTVDLTGVVLEEQGEGAFTLAEVKNVSDEKNCEPVSVSAQTFRVAVTQAKVCDYQYTIADSQGIVSYGKASSALARVVVTNGDVAELTPISHVALVNDGSADYESLIINLSDELSGDYPDITSWTLNASVTQPFANGAAVNVNSADHQITYTPKQNFSGIDRLMYSYVDSSTNTSYSGTIDIAVAHSANQGIDLLVPEAVYSSADKSYVPLVDAKAGLDIDVVKQGYVKSIDGDDIQLIYVNSLSAPLTSIKAGQEANETNTTLTFKATTENVHVVTYVVSDHKGSYQIGHVVITVLDESKLGSWDDVTYTHDTNTVEDDTLFLAPLTLNEAIANSYPFDQSVNERVNGTAYNIAVLMPATITGYCTQLNAEIATSEELKSMVDRGWLDDANWPNTEKYLVIDRASGELRVMDIKAGAYSINTSTLESPVNDEVYFPACIVRSNSRFVTSLQLSAKLRAGSSSISVPNGHSIEVMLTKYFNDGSWADTEVADSANVSFSQSVDLLTQGTGSDFKYFTAHTMGTTKLTGQYYPSYDPLISNAATITVIDALPESGTVSFDSSSLPMGTERVLDGTIYYSDGSSKSVSDEPVLTWLIDGVEVSSYAGNVIDSIFRKGSSWVLKAGTQTGSVDISWSKDSVTSTEQTLIVSDAVFDSFSRTTVHDSADETVISNSFPVGRPFKIKVYANFTNGSEREISSEITQAEWEHNKTYVSQSASVFNQFTPVDTVSSNNTKCGGVGTEILAWKDGQSICSVVEITSAYLVDVKIEPSSITLPRGTSTSIKVKGIYSDGAENELKSCLLSSSNTSNVTVTQSGEVTAVNSATIGGSATINARCNSPYGELTGGAVVTVSDAVLTSINISPLGGQTSVGRLVGLRYLATGYYSDGTSQGINTKVSWKLTDTSGIPVSGASWSVNTLTLGRKVKYQSRFLVSATLNGVVSNKPSLYMEDTFKHGLYVYTGPIEKKWWGDIGSICRDSHLSSLKYGRGHTWSTLSRSQIDVFYDNVIKNHFAADTIYNYNSYPGFYGLDSAVFWTNESYQSKQAYTRYLLRGGGSYDWQNTNYMVMCKRDA